MKYIDAEKLIAELERRIKQNEVLPHRYIRLNEDKLLLSFITSLQQEQPESICPRCIYRNKTDDICEYPYDGRDCFINENGVYKCNGFEEVKHQEQPEVDMEKEFTKKLYEALDNLEGQHPAFADSVYDNAYCEAISDVKRVIASLKEE